MFTFGDFLIRSLPVCFLFSFCTDRGFFGKFIVSASGFVARFAFQDSGILISVVLVSLLLLPAGLFFTIFWNIKAGIRKI
jgi:hypothetical protein